MWGFILFQKPNPCFSLAITTGSNTELNNLRSKVPKLDLNIDKNRHDSLTSKSTYVKMDLAERSSKPNALVIEVIIIVRLHTEL